MAVVSRERGETYDDLAFDYDNLALIRHGMGDLPGAEALLVKARAAAALHKHRNLAPIMVDLADVRCLRGATADGLALLETARPIMAATYPTDPRRMAWLDTIKGECSLGAGQAQIGARPDRGRCAGDWEAVEAGQPLRGAGAPLLLHRVGAQPATA